MKKNNIIVLCLLLVMTHLSCKSYVKFSDINCEYKGAIIYDRHDFTKMDRGILYYIKYEGRIFPVRVYEIDNNYKIGDTINGDCLFGKKMDKF